MTASFVGSALGKATAIFRSHGLTPFRRLLSPEFFSRAWCRQATPKTILIPEVVFWLMVTAALGDGSMTSSITAFWATLRAAWPLLPVTEEAFCLTRRALPLRFFLRLFADVVARFTSQLDARFRRASNQHGPSGCPQARLVGLVGLWDVLCYAFRLTSLGVGEQERRPAAPSVPEALGLVVGRPQFSRPGDVCGGLDPRQRLPVPSAFQPFPGQTPNSDPRPNPPMVCRPGSALVPLGLRPRLKPFGPSGL
jgi:hypothetical protein